MVQRGSRRVKTAAVEHSRQLLADIPFKCGIVRSHQTATPATLLVARRYARTHRNVLQMQQTGFISVLREAVVANAHGEIHIYAGEKGPRTVDAVHL